MVSLNLVSIGRELAKSLTAALFCILGASAAWCSEWPMYQGDARHTGYLPITFSDKFEVLKWKTTVTPGKVLSRPVVAGGKLFVTSSTSSGSKLLVALDASNGANAWATDFGQTFSANPPSVDNGSVYVQTVNGDNDTYLRAYDAASGALKFKTAHRAAWNYYYAPTIYQGTVYVNGGYEGGAYAFDAVSGIRHWWVSLPRSDLWTPAVNSNYVIAYVNDSLFMLDRASGTKSFTIKNPKYSQHDYSMNLAPVLTDANHVIVVESGYLTCFDLVARNLAWQLGPGFTGQPATAKGVIYAISSNTLAAYNETDGQLKWSWAPAGGETLQGDVIVTDSHVIVTGDQHVFGISLASQKADWSYAGTGKIAVTADTVYVASTSGTIAALGMGAADAAPDNLVFSPIVNAPLETAITSNSVSITGINVETKISITGGEYALNGGGYTTAAGFVRAGDIVRVRVQSATIFATKKTATLTVGTANAMFDVTTPDPNNVDVTPDNVSFSPQVAVPVGTAMTSNSVTLSGIDFGAKISISGGEYSLNGGAYRIVTGIVRNGDNVRIRLKSAPSYSSRTTARLTVGTISATFEVTTLDDPFARATLSTSSLNFTSNRLGVPAASQAVTLKNIGKIELNLINIAASGDFSASSQCGGSLAAGESCQIIVVFTPSTSGTRTGELSVTTNGSVVPGSVTLSGRYVESPPTASLSAHNLTFTSSGFGITAANQVVTLKNTGTSPLTSINIAVGGDFSASSQCNGTLAAGESCQITVQFTPSSYDQLPARLFVWANGNVLIGSVSLMGICSYVPTNGDPSYDTVTNLLRMDRLSIDGKAYAKVQLLLNNDGRWSFRGGAVANTAYSRDPNFASADQVLNLPNLAIDYKRFIDVKIRLTSDGRWAFLAASDLTDLSKLKDYSGTWRMTNVNGAVFGNLSITQVGRNLTIYDPIMAATYQGSFSLLTRAGGVYQAANTKLTWSVEITSSETATMTLSCTASAGYACVLPNGSFFYLKKV